MTTQREFLERRRQIRAMGQKLWVVSPEDTILSKLDWMKGRESDVQYSDALGVAVAQWGSLDIEYLHGGPSRSVLRRCWLASWRRPENKWKRQTDWAGG